MKDEETTTDPYSKILETWGKYIGFLLAVGGLISLIASNEIVAFAFLTIGCLLLEVWLRDIWRQGEYIKKCFTEGRPLPPVIYSESKRKNAKVAFGMVGISYVALSVFLAIKSFQPVPLQLPPIPTLIPTAIPTQSLTSAACKNLTSRIYVGAKVHSENKIDINLNIRKIPGLSAPIITSVVNGTEFIVLGGPVCTDGIMWWEMSTTNGVSKGWVAEVNSNGTYYIEP